LRLGQAPSLAFSSLQVSTQVHAERDRRPELTAQPLTMHPLLPVPQIAVPNPAKVPRIINCDAPSVDCSNKELYGPCCATNRKRSQRKARRH
jgi:hypothetical protein